MDKRNRYFTLAALIVAVLACVSAGLMLLVKGTIALKIFTPTNPATIDWVLRISAGLVILGLAVYAMLDPESVRKFLTGRQARYGSNALVMTLAFVGIILTVNYLAFNNPKTWDLTEDKANTLSPELVQALKQLPAPMKATGFFTSQMPKDTAQKLLDNMKSNSDGKFDYTFEDPNANPVQSRTLGITGDGKILLEMNGHNEIVATADETSMLQAIIRLINPEARTVYFLIGHGEHDINGSDNNAFSKARTTLESKNYTVRTLNLSAENAVPADAKAVIIAGPTKPVSEREVTLLNDYLTKGGSLIVMEDPTPLTDFGDAPDPLYPWLETNWGIRLRNDIIIDTQGNPATMAVANAYNPSHPITRNMNNQGTVFPLARSIELVKPPQDVTVDELAETVNQSWGETDFAMFKDQGQVKFDQGQDVIGPMILAAAAERQASSRARVVVFGNSAFATDQAFDTVGNGDLFINAVDWAAEQESQIGITPKQATQRTFNPPGQLQWILILLGSVFVLPGAVLVAGIASWLNRRRRG